MLLTIEKTKLRKDALKLRFSNPYVDEIKSKSCRILTKIIKSSDFVMAKNVALYFPIKNEIDITGLFKISNKNFYLPRCSKNNLEFVKFVSFEKLQLSKWGILEPVGEKINPEILDIIYIPALLVNKKGYRIGYGKGFYDRFLVQNNVKAKKVAVISSEFICPFDFQEENDIKCDYLISDLN